MGLTIAMQSQALQAETNLPRAFPAGVLHFSHNYNCEPAAFLANFGQSDPGTQTMWGSMMQIPTSILHMSTGIPEDTINLLKNYPRVVAPGTGGEECLRRCGLNFTQVSGSLGSIADLIVGMWLWSCLWSDVKVSVAIGAEQLFIKY